jgi:EAL domain-containing protein (putative c-di-GMP-specific phosphodiesterase class I)
MDPRRWFSGITWMVIWIVAAMIQFFNNELLLVGYAGAIGVSILFLKLENPEGYLERRTGVYNEQALRMFLDDSYKKKRPFYMLRIVLNKLENQEEILYTVQMDSLVRKITAYFESLNGVSVFKHAGWEYTLLFLKEEQMNDAAEAVLKRFDASWHIDKKLIDIDVEIIKVPDCYIVYDANQMLEVLQMFVMHSKRHGLTGIQSMEESWIERKKKDAAASKTIEDAIRENRIEVFYQPIYSTKEKCFVSAEALSRIRTKDGSILPPAAFIPVAEKNGMIIPIGEIVFRKTCEFIQTEKLWEKGIQYIEINLSALQCSQDDLAENYIRIMEETGINPQMINLEITESAALESKDVLLANMNKLIEYGVSFSLDDFGTGYSNLNYILELPVQIVKFDRQMTTSYFENEKGRLIMEAAIGMIKAVGMKIVSEGVETKEQLDTLSEIEINYIQGFYFSKPVCGEEFLKLL